MAESTTNSAVEQPDTAVPSFNSRALAAKRICDLVIGSVALVAMAVPMIAIAALIKLTSKGPVLFRQERVGRGGKTFTLLKFRTMIDGVYDRVRNDADLWNVYVSHDHKLPAHVASITRIGGLLRKLSLDELPQLINILRGEMSLVGVRPIERTQLELRPADSQRLYKALRPGLTGLWQVEGRSTVRHEDRTALEDRYVTSWSPLTDFTLLLRTPLAVLRMRRSI